MSWRSSDIKDKLPVHETNIFRWIWDATGKYLHSVNEWFWFNLSFQALGNRSRHLMHFDWRVKSSSNEEWRGWIIQTTPYTSSSVYKKTKNSPIRQWTSTRPVKNLFFERLRMKIVFFVMELWPWWLLLHNSVEVRPPYNCLQFCNFKYMQQIGSNLN